MRREIDKRNSIKVVTKNELIVADGLATLSLNARKLLYLAMAQCKKGDKEFYQYSVSPTDLASIWGVDRTELYHRADLITDELMRLFLRISKDGNKRYFRKKHVFESCEYDEEHKITFELHKDMTDLLLNVTGNFTQPVLWDFMKMRSKYSIAIWHLMQREMHSGTPSVLAPVEFELTLQELREVTGTENKLKQIGQFRERVLDQAIREIRENLLADITYDYVKKGQRIVGFRFTAISCLGVLDPEELTLRDRQRIRKAQLTRKKADGQLTAQEAGELDYLNHSLYQMRFDDYYG